MEIKVLVADDELPARGELKYQLASMPHVNVIGECANGKEVISFLETHPQVDLLFLDIEMPIMNGLEAAQKIIGMNHSVKIVFATGYSQFALQAFDLEAFDYILKPYDEGAYRENHPAPFRQYYAAGKRYRLRGNHKCQIQDFFADEKQDTHSFSRKRNRPDFHRKIG